jgi:diguanylate cyclase (GGDEF)-like protein/PAS domain S-box-containing protein
LTCFHNGIGYTFEVTSIQSEFSSALTKQMTIRYIIALTIIAALSFTAYFSLNAVIQSEEENASILNTSGRQRMLSQRLTYFSERLTGTVDKVKREEIRRKLLEAANLMERSHKGLIHGDPAMGLLGNPTAKISAMYFSPPMELDKKVNTFLSEVKALVKSPNGELSPDNPHLHSILGIASSSLLNSLDKVVSQYQRESEAYNTRLQQIETIVLITTLFTLMMEALFIFRPMVRRVREEKDKLIETAEKLRLSEKRYRSIVEDQTELICRFTPDLTVTFVNSAYCNYCGKNEAKLIGNAFIFPATAPKKEQNQLEKLIRSLEYDNPIEKIEFPEASTDSEISWQSWTIRALFNKERDIIEYQIVGRDISELKQAEESLLLSQFNLEMLNSIIIKANASLELEEVLGSILDSITTATGATAGMIFFSDLKSKQLKLGVSKGLSQSFVDECTDHPIDFGHGLTGSIAKSKKMIYIQEGASNDPRIAHMSMRDEAFNSFVGIPIFSDNRVIAVMSIMTHSQEILNKGHESLIETIAHKVGSAIRNAQLYTELEQAGKDLNLTAAVFQNAIEGIVITDQDTVIETVNPAFCEVTGYTQEELIGQKANILKSGQHDEPYYKSMWADLNTQGKWRGEIVNRRKNGELFHQWISIFSIFDEQGKVNRYASVVTEISEIKEREEQYKFQAHHDFLTGLPNRRLFADRLAQEIIYAERYEQMIGVVMLDLDKFKQVNDTMGHFYGDALLQEVAKRLEGCVRKSDTVSRLGGDEFVLLIPRIKDISDAIRIAQKIVDSFKLPMDFMEEKISVTASVGISSYPEHGNDFDTLIKNVDIAMYLVKNRGGNGYLLFDPSQAD